MNSKARTTVLSIVVIMMMVSLGCTVNTIIIDTVEVGELLKESHTVELNDADDARVYIKMGAGELQIDSGAEELLEADFTYNVAEWKPEIEYKVTDGSGRLTIRQPQTYKVSMHSDARYEWDLKFKDNVPLDIRIECGAGESDIELGSLNVTQLDMKLGAGDAKIDLDGNTSLTDLELDIGVGSITVELNGDWEHNVDVEIQGGIGQIKLRLPENIGVRVNITKGVGDVDASGLYRRGNSYVNRAYDNADVILEVNIQAGVGQIDLEVVD